jgi:hypothetical protein
MDPVTSGLLNSARILQLCSCKNGNAQQLVCHFGVRSFRNKPSAIFLGECKMILNGLIQS